MIRKDLTGQTFNQLTVISFAGTKSNKSYWTCACSCGEVRVVRGAHLQDGFVQSCGCLRRENGKAWGHKRRLEIGVAPMNKLYSIYKRHAATRDYVWELSKKEFKLLTSSSCSYCGKEPDCIYHADSHTTRSEWASENKYVYNGIDRVDNKLGYVLTNCVSCCKLCNLMKRDLDKEDFLNHIKRLYEFEWGR